MKITNSGIDGEGCIWLSKKPCSIEVSGITIQNFTVFFIDGETVMGKIKICIDLIIWIFGGNKDKYKTPDLTKL